MNHGRRGVTVEGPLKGSRICCNSSAGVGEVIEMVEVEGNE